MQFHNLKESPQFKGRIQEITLDIWPSPLSEALIENASWQALESLFPETQLLLLDTEDQIIGIANTIPFYWAGALPALPDQGWDWMLAQGIDGKKRNIPPNYLGGLQIGIHKHFQGQGYSRIMVDKAKEVCQRKGLNHLVIPVRPSFKHLFPKEDIHQYLLRKKGAHLYDPWLRTHEKSGAQILKVCSSSMTIPKPIDAWQKYLDQAITESSEYIIPGLLNPVFMDLKQQEGVYREPNVWVYYP